LTWYPSTINDVCLWSHWFAVIEVRRILPETGSGCIQIWRLQAWSCKFGKTGRPDNCVGLLLIHQALLLSKPLDSSNHCGCPETLLGSRLPLLSCFSLPREGCYSLNDKQFFNVKFYVNMYSSWSNCNNSHSFICHKHQIIIVFLFLSVFLGMSWEFLLRYSLYSIALSAIIYFY
jgi:hypothetical protein